MIVSLQDREYTINTPTENVLSLIEYLNNYCLEHDLKNSKGEPIHFEVNLTSPFYMILFGFSYLTSLLQSLLYSAAKAFSIAESNEAQLLNLADIAGVKRKQPSRTTIQCVIGGPFVPDPDDPPPSCMIYTTDTVTAITDQGPKPFHPAFDLEVKPETYGTLILVAEETGPLIVEPNTITEFDAPKKSLRSMTNAAAVPGRTLESIASLRARIQDRQENGTQLDAAAAEIEELEGVSRCTIYFNYSAVADSQIQEITIPPRQALLLVQGYNERIPQVFYNHLMCLTVPGPSDRTFQLAYTTKANQKIPVHIVTPKQQPVHIRVNTSTRLTTAQVDQLKDAVATLMFKLTISSPLTSTMVTDTIRENMPLVQVDGVELSASGSSLWTYKIEPDGDAILSISSANITVHQDVSND